MKLERGARRDLKCCTQNLGGHSDGNSALEAGSGASGFAIAAMGFGPALVTVFIVVHSFRNGDVCYVPLHLVSL